MDSGYYRKRKSFDWRSALRKLLRNRKLLFGLSLGIPLAGVVLFGNHGLVRRARLLDEKATLQLRILEQEKEIARLGAESRALDGDRKTIERVAREKYGMARAGETVYRVQPAQ
jgi:cell division protein FtsB